jgi:hypothetical protein
MVDDFAQRGYPPLNIKSEFKEEANATGRPRYRFSRHTLQRVAKHRKKAANANDLVSIFWLLKNPIVTKKRNYKFAKKTLYRWIERCLFLARPLTHDWLGGRQRLHVSLTDLKTIARMLDNPCGWQLPGNSGVWLADGIYRDKDDQGNDALWFSCEHLETTHGPVESLWSHWARKGHPAFPLEDEDSAPLDGKPRSQKPQWPTRKNPHGGTMLVIHETDVDRILKWRTASSVTVALPGLQGSWLSKEVFRDEKGQLWVTNKWVQDNAGKSDIFAGYWHKRGKLPRKRIGRPGQLGGRARVFVYLLDRVNSLLSSGAADPGEEPEEAITDGGTENEQPKQPLAVRLTDRQRLILETMLEMELTSEPRKETHQAIVNRINRHHDANNYKRDFAVLHKKGLIDSIRGPDGGVWLTEQGMHHARQN